MYQPPPKKNVLIIAGEASGDYHGANLVAAMKKMDASLSFWGMGGAKMKVAGVDLVKDIEELAVFGITDVLAKIRPILKTFSALKKGLLSRGADLIILIDYPGFNLRFARMAKRKGFKIAYYITPKVWAWGEGRMTKIRESVDKALVIFPFEEKLFQNAGIPVAFVGNPLLDCVKPSLTRSEARELFGLQKDAETIVLLPGSRRGEIKRLLPEMLGAGRILSQNKPQRQFIMALAASVAIEDVREMIATSGLDIKIARDNTHNAINCADVAIATSGTVTLETAILGVPMVIIYKVSPLTYYLGKCVVKTPFMGLPNIVLGKEVARELLQDFVTPARIAQEIEAILAQKEIAVAALAGVKAALGEGNAIERAANEAYLLLMEGA